MKAMTSNQAPFLSDFVLHKRTYLASVIVSLGAMAFGYDTGVASGVVVLPSFLYSVTGTTTLSAAAKADLSSNVVSILFLGAFVAAIVALPVTLRFGPRIALALAGIVFIIGAIVQIVTEHSLAAVYIGRVLSGFGIGMISNAANSYIAEISPARIRGKTGTMFQMFLVIGGIISFFTVYGISKNLPGVPSSIQWRLAFGLQMPGALLMLSGLAFIPESPRWLAYRGDIEKATSVISWLRQLPETDPQVAHEIAEIIASINEEREARHGLTIKEIFRKGYRDRFIFSTSVTVFFMFTGQNSILYYGPTIFASIGYGTNAGLLASGLFGVIKVACTPLFAIFFVDRFGRKTLLQVGNILKAGVLFTFAGLTSGKIDPHSARGNAAAAMLYLYMVFYSFSYGPLIWIMICEPFDNKTRQWGVMYAVALTWILNYAISKITPIGINNIGYKFWIVIGILNLLAFAGTWILPETQGKTLEEMDIIFSTTTPAVREANIEKALGHKVNEIANSYSKDQDSLAVVSTAASVDHNVLIIGGGLVGLTLAQGLRKRGIKATVFERDINRDGRTQGYAITFHWALECLEQMYPKDIFDRLDDTSVDPKLSLDEGHFLVIDGRNCSPILDIPPSKRRIRANRSKFRKLILEGLDIIYEKRFRNYEITPDGVIAHFEDGSSFKGSFLVGCDGNNSLVRRQLVGEVKAALNPCGITMGGVVQYLTPEQAKPYRDIDPLLFQTIHPETRNFIWYSIQDISDDGNTIAVLTMVSHPILDPTDELPKNATSKQVIADIKKRAEGFAEPMFSLINNIDENLPATNIHLVDWLPVPYNSQGRVALAGDAAGPMTMFRGEAVNHGTLDAMLLCDVLTKHTRGKIDITEGIEKYEAEVRARRMVATPLSRQAAIDAHLLGGFPLDSPLVTRRAGPEVASTIIET
ncbi:hypothetical protein VKT23_008744 [Stygiomarasmius scandens]|uniref:Major facilitator superfamily (MFS) profile domain-containing protein n=1 Tax=Marasmiellus scandens TaxID=2682957 RepID=A0ABR1JHV2_9AGAR